MSGGGAQVSSIRWTTISFLVQCVVPLPVRKHMPKSYIKNKIVPVLKNINEGLYISAP